jgi:hypothetical protein
LRKLPVANSVRFVSIDRWAELVDDQLTIAIRNLRRLP